MAFWALLKAILAVEKLREIMEMVITDRWKWIGRY
jgi:hypothetical protein